MKFILLIRSSWFSLNLQGKKNHSFSLWAIWGPRLIVRDPTDIQYLYLFSLLPRNTFSSLANPNKMSSVNIVGALL